MSLTILLSLKVTQGHSKLSPLYRACVRIPISIPLLPRPHFTRYWSKIAISPYPTFYPTARTEEKGSEYFRAFFYNRASEIPGLSRDVNRFYKKSSVCLQLSRALQTSDRQTDGSAITIAECLVSK